MLNSTMTSRISDRHTAEGLAIIVQWPVIPARVQRLGDESLSSCIVTLGSYLHESLLASSREGLTMSIYFIARKRESFGKKIG